jgi:hypothetical protein
MLTKRRSSTLILNIWLKPKDNNDDDGTVRKRPDHDAGSWEYGLKDVDPDGRGFTCYRAWVPGFNSPREYRYRIESRVMQVFIAPSSEASTGGRGGGYIRTWDVHAKGKSLKDAIILQDESDNMADATSAYNVDISEFVASVFMRMAQDVVKAYNICRYAQPHEISVETGACPLIAMEIQRALIDLIELHVQQTAGEERTEAGYPYEYDHPGHRAGAEQDIDLATADRWDRVQHKHGPEEAMPYSPNIFARSPRKWQAGRENSPGWEGTYGFLEEEEQQEKPVSKKGEDN